MQVPAKMSVRASSIDCTGFRLLLGVVVVLVVTSCGGGGSNPTPTPTPTPPTAIAGGPYAADVTQTITFDGSKSSDPSGLSLTYAWNFGDSTTGSGVKPTHAYTVTDTYKITLVVTNREGARSSGATATATIAATSYGERWRAVHRGHRPAHCLRRVQVERARWHCTDLFLDLWGWRDRVGR
jgi:hypothetical protein